MVRACIVSVAILTLPLTVATAQSSAIVPGQRVRIHTTDAAKLTGRVEHVRNDILVLSPDARSGQVAVPLHTITRLDIRQRASPGQGAWRWAKRGFVVGAVMGAVTCSVDVETCRESPDMSEAEIVLGSALFFGGGAAVLGAVGGALFPGGYWERVPVPEYAYFGPDRTGRLALSATWKLRPGRQ